MTKPKGNVLGAIIGVLVGIVFGTMASLFQHADLLMSYLFGGLIIGAALGWAAGGYIASGKE
ncbi:MAG TPA: hypothetical protein VHS31_10980 [Tepidisphaeraceae bacterium]|jgi:hypothetical protein|nr:hypothetical protein [Tepidisphaeraceae bacterium]